MKNDFKTFDSMCKGIVKQAKENLGLPVRVNNGIKVVVRDILYSIYWDDGLEQLCGVPSSSSKADRLWIEISDLVNNTELLPYYDLAVENRERALSSIYSLIKRKYSGLYPFITPFKVTHHSNLHLNGTATIDRVFCSESADGKKLAAIDLENGKQISILPEDYYTVLEHIQNQEKNED